MKKGPLANTEKSFIDENKNNLDATAIAKKLDRSLSIIDNYLNQTIDTTVNNDHDKTKTKNSDINLYARNKDRGVVVMTENASITADEKKKSPKVYETRKYRNIIHKIKED